MLQEARFVHTHLLGSSAPEDSGTDGLEVHGQDVSDVCCTAAVEELDGLHEQHAENLEAYGCEDAFRCFDTSGHVDSAQHRLYRVHRCHDPEKLRYNGRESEVGMVCAAEPFPAPGAGVGICLVGNGAWLAVSSWTARADKPHKTQRRETLCVMRADGGWQGLVLWKGAPSGTVQPAGALQEFPANIPRLPETPDCCKWQQLHM